MSIKRIMLSGYFGFDNAGDEAICEAMIQSLKALEPNLEIIVLSGNPEKTRDRYGVEAVNRTDLAAIWKALRKTDLFISGGGSLLQDKTGSLTIPYYLGVIHLAKLAKVPVAVFAQGIGPVEKPMFQKWIARLFRSLAYVSVRDSDSRKLLLDWGVAEEKIDQVVDPVFLLHSSGEERGRQLLLAEGIDLKKPPLLLSIRKWKEGEGDFDVFAQLCDRLVEENEEIVFLPFHYPDDLNASIDIVARMKKKAHVVQGSYSPSELMDMVSVGKMMVAMRLHALIFAAARQVPCVGISYDPKIDAFLHLINEKAAGYSGSLDPDQLYVSVKSVLGQEEKAKQDLQTKAEQLKDLAMRPANKVMELIK
ncbi:polysaccharide pyruvyl transferase CsaB [Ammoniphilus resinae]|uniref:Polysaccharide pyruvyl transferase CsaB n=1 Tax=Ammoniphilus resinae TaxID=861532 RepID=A0ABS4GJB3_9BACL|nr:polysaccharide pyruvyl transferase CsaB [Ammoniphilus resinae]MBP1930350.1 polysaccharide pyruvyl transferase CsaB [Ammoniphilus resinae]